MTYYCSDCDKLFFAGRTARDQHCQATGHALPAFECDSCSDCFDDEYDRCEHMNLEQHWAENAPECTICLFHAVTEEEVVRHEVEEHNYCADCKRTFMNLNCIRQVSKSSSKRDEVLMGVAFEWKDSSYIIGDLSFLQSEM
uniref:WGS project CBMI000000000 data, contig CS3069_c001111 n=1 Tax=Fusarium clavum TaxID=2594811 RepID=A0A090MHH8_9HYPO|nr:unnamed protein product [Fusarium clavum]